MRVFGIRSFRNPANGARTINGTLKTRPKSAFSPLTRASVIRARPERVGQRPEDRREEEVVPKRAEELPDKEERVVAAVDSGGRGAHSAGGHHECPRQPGMTRGLSGAPAGLCDCRPAPFQDDITPAL